MFEPNRIKLNTIINNKIREINDFHKYKIKIQIPNDLELINLNLGNCNIFEFENDLYYFIESLDYNTVTEYLNKITN